MRMHASHAPVRRLVNHRGEGLSLPELSESPEKQFGPASRTLVGGEDMRSLMLFVVVGCIALSPQSGNARDHDDDHGRKHWKDDDDHHRRYGDSCFREEHLRVIREYYHERQLPPGLAKKYYRTGQLPRGWERRIQPFPYQVERSLPPVPAGCTRGYVDGYAVVYQPRTRMVIDFRAVFGN